MIFIQDTLLGFKYQKEALVNTPKSQGLGVFLELDVGTGYGFADAAGKAGFKVFRAHPTFKDDHNWKNSLPEVVRIARKYDAICAKYPNTKWYLSTGCEHKLDKNTAKHFFDVVNAAVHHCEVVNCPLPEGAVVDGCVNEFHGKSKLRSTNYAYSADGDSLVDMNCTLVKEQFINAKYFGIWDPQYNQRSETDDKTPRPKRRITPSSDLIKSLVALATERGVTSLPKKWLYKSHAEKQLTPDPRSDKAMFIIPIKAAKIELKRNGQLIATIPYYGTYADGRYRYYGKEYGYKLGVVDVIVNGKKYGTINGVFRDGEYR